ncbi:hypothetical protein GW17_00051014, partial [Ensete ventricosum]
NPFGEAALFSFVVIVDPTRADLITAAPQATQFNHTQSAGSNIGPCNEAAACVKDAVLDDEEASDLREEGRGSYGYAVYRTQLNSNHILRSLLIPHLKGKVRWIVTTLVNLVGVVLVWMAARDPVMARKMRSMSMSAVVAESTITVRQSSSKYLRYSTATTPSDKKRCTCISDLTHPGEGMLTKDEISTAPCSRVRDGDRDAVVRAAVGIGASHLMKNHMPVL